MKPACDSPLRSLAAASPLPRSRSDQVCRAIRGLLLISVACAGWSVSIAEATAATVPVVRCQTEFGISGSAPNTPSHLTVAGGTRGLVAYTNTESYLLAPSGMRCFGIAAVDGGSQVIAWPPGRGRPGLHSHSEGLTLTLDPACAGCKAGDACPFFPGLARGLGFPCPAGVPARERVYQDSRTSHSSRISPVWRGQAGRAEGRTRPTGWSATPATRLTAPCIGRPAPCQRASTRSAPRA